MAKSFQFREQAERCRRLARDSIDPNLRDGLFGLAEEYAARAASARRRMTTRRFGRRARTTKALA